MNESTDEDAPKRPHEPRNDLEARAQATVADIEAHVRARKADLEAANARIEARVGRNIPFAVGVGVVLGGGFLVSLIFVTWLFIPFGALLIGFTVLELATGLRHAGRDVPRVASVIAAVATVPVGFFYGVTGLWLAVIGAIGLVSLWRVLEVLRPSQRVPAIELFRDLGAGALVQLYVTFLAGFMVVLTGIDGGQWWVLAAAIIVVTTDTAAYFSGLLFGRHAMAPGISPNKTWEGFAGAMLFALIAGVLLALLMLGEPWWLGIVIGLGLALTATLGDLSESLLKRGLGVKDMSGWLPGHGGFLDRLDSMIPAGAVIYAFYFLLGPG